MLNYLLFSKGLQRVKKLSRYIAAYRKLNTMILLQQFSWEVNIYIAFWAKVKDLSQVSNTMDIKS